MADLTQLYGELEALSTPQKITTLLRLLNQNTDLNVYHFGIIQRLKSGEGYDADGPLTLERLQIIGNEVKVIKPKPVKETKASKNGKGGVKDIPLAEQPAEEQPEVVEA
jgi:hypothetical protein